MFFIALILLVICNHKYFFVFTRAVVLSVLILLLCARSVAD